MNVIVDGLIVNYRREGSGPPILLLHGWGDRLETFESMCPLLTPSFEVIRLDLAGFGNSQAPESAWGLEEYGLYVQHFIEKIGLVPKAIVGHSNGGAIAIKAVADNVLKPDYLVLLSSAGIRATNSGRKMTWKLLSKLGKAALVFAPAGIKQKIRARLYASVGSDILVAPHMEATFKRIVSQDVQSDAAKITIPVLIINGTSDTATPPDYARRFSAAINGSTIKFVEGADHFMHQQHPDTIASHIREFIR